MTTCGKNSYPTKADAKRAGKQFANVAGGPILRAYACGACDRWHIGHVTSPARPCAVCGKPIAFEVRGTGKVPIHPDTGNIHGHPRHALRAAGIGVAS